MNCQECGRLLYPNQLRCPCGWKVPPKRREPPPFRPADPRCSGEVTRKKFAAKLREVDAYVAMYIAKHPGSNQKEACFSYMREHNLTHILPKHLQQDDSDQEARLERQAIQAEGT